MRWLACHPTWPPHTKPSLVLFRWTDSLTTVAYSLNSHRALSPSPSCSIPLPLFYVYMPAFRIYFSLPCSSFPLLTHHMCLRLSIVLPSISHFPPPCFCVTKYYVFSRYFTSLLPAVSCYFQLYVYIFSLSPMLSLSCAPHFSTSSQSSTTSFPSTHTQHHSHFLLPL